VKSNRWSQRVTGQSKAFDLEAGVFTLKDPKAIAAWLKRSAKASTRRKMEPFGTAMSMLVFSINRAGKTPKARERTRLEQAKKEVAQSLRQSALAAGPVGIRPPRIDMHKAPVDADAAFELA
jgi:hypothetical protein